MTPSEDPAIGATGRLIMATRGAAGPGEVLLRIGGGTEAYLAFSEEPLAVGTEVLAWNNRGQRSVDVLQFGPDDESPD